MSDHNERACNHCGSLLHHENDCPRLDEPKAAVTISRMSSPETIRVRLRIGREFIEVDVELADFALAMTGRADVPAKPHRRFTRP